MARALGTVVPVGGLTVGVSALVLWVSGVALGWLDLLVLLLLVVGLGLSLAGYTLGASDRARRLGVVAIGCNVFGLVLFGLLYAAG